MRRIACLPILILTPLLMGAAPKPPALRLEITLVVGRDGNKLAAGEVGWVVVRFSNTSKNTIYVPSALFQGKGAKANRLNASYSSFSAANGYYVPPDDFAVAQFTYAFVPDATGQQSPDWLPLSPPDDPMEWKPGEHREVWRLMRAPMAAGRYKLKLKFSNDGAVKALSTLNYTLSPLPDPIAVEATADKVEIAPTK